MKAIIWGANGQDGYYLSSLLQQQGVEVVPVTRSPQMQIEITNYDEVVAFIRHHQADYLFNFAADSTTRHDAWQNNHDTISTGTLHILEAIKEHSPGTRVFLSGSGLQFRNNGLPINEKDAFDVTSIYAVARIHMTYLARYYRRFGLKIYVGYFFNHDSPRRSDRHINKKIIDVAQRIANGSTEKLSIGDVTVRKEFGFAGDIVKAVWTLVQQETVQEAVIGTGNAYAIADWLQICFSKYGLQWQDHVVAAEQFTPEYKVLVSDPSTIKGLGWEPETTIEGLANLMCS